MIINKEELKIAKILTDIVGFYGLVLFWTLLLSTLPVSVIIMMQKAQWDSKAWAFAISILILVIAAFIFKKVAKAVISRSRIILIIIGFVLLGFAFYNGFIMFSKTEFQIFQEPGLIVSTIIQSILGFSCIIQVFSKKNKR